MPSCCWMRRIPRGAHPDLGVERRERLIEEQQPRLDGERPREGDALLLAARQLVRIALRGVAELDRSTISPTRLAMRPGPRPKPQPVADVLRGGHVGEQGVRLEHHADAPSVDGQS